MADNGAEGLLLEATPTLNGETSLGALIEKHYNNELENVGQKDSFTWHGASWACASMAPSGGFKTCITEGGIRCPCVVRYPPPQAQSGRTHQRLKHGHGYSANDSRAGWDLSPAPGVVPRPRDHAVAGQIAAIVSLGRRHQDRPSVHDQDTAVTGWGLSGLRGIRKGRWKATYVTPPRGKDAWELYGMEADPGEIHSQADAEPEILAGLIYHWIVYCNETGLYDPGIVYHAVEDKKVTQ